MKMNKIPIIILLFFTLITLSCQKESLYQHSTLQALMLGGYDGTLPLFELKQKGDIGLGTFDKIDGEMILLDGKVYQAFADGRVAEAKDDLTTPFACVAFFDPDFATEVEEVTSFTALTTLLNSAILNHGTNRLYFIKFQAQFTDIHFRSVLPQQKPYKPLDQVVKTDQREFKENSVTGTVVGVYFPSYLSGVNATGWHLHFLSHDKTMGGHLLDCTFDHAKIHFDLINSINIDLPKSPTFNSFDLNSVSKEAIIQVESSR